MVMSFWWKKVQLFLGLLLAPISWPIEWAYRFRRFAYNYKIFSRHEFHVPIISVGNIAFGGTGKTPLVIWLAEYLSAQEKKVMILTRGYRGKLEHSRGILRAGGKLGFNPVEYGDEALLLVRRLKKASVVVGKDRSNNLETYFPQENPDVVLLDDGFQHLQLKRQLNIVLFDGQMPMEKYKVVPRGYLREGLTALRDADVVIVGRSDQASKEQKEILRNLISPYLSDHVAYVEMAYRTVGVFDANYHLVFDSVKLKDKKVICVAGIAAPHSFFNSMESLGAKVIKKITYPDHHYYRQEEVQELLKMAQDADARLVTTEKDMVKIRRFVDPEAILFLEIEASFLSGEKEMKERIAQVL
jgi:tetraacyldisaccharide 4'-kinase